MKIRTKNLLFIQALTFIGSVIALALVFQINLYGAEQAYLAVRTPPPVHTAINFPAKASLI